MSQIRIALLGAGRIGKRHAASIFQNPDTTLAWVADPVPGVASEVAEQWGGRPTKDPDEALTASDVDAVVVASATPTHIGFIEAAVAAGKPVFSEKPIGLDLAAVDAVAKRLEGKNAHIQIGFHKRFDPAFQEIHDRITNGEIGRLEQLAIVSRDPEPASHKLDLAYLKTSGGIFRDMTIHDFDLARYLLGDIVEVRAVGTNLIDPEIKQLDDYDGAIVVLTSKSGAVATITNSRHSAAGYDQRLEAFGAKGTLRVDNVRGTTVTADTATQTDAAGPFLNFFLERFAAAYCNEFAAFATSIQQSTQPSPSFADGREALALANAAFESARTGHSVSFAPGKK